MGKSKKQETCLQLWTILGSAFFATWVDQQIQLLSRLPLGNGGIAIGIPDLLLWKMSIHGKYDVRFVEVKAQGDKLRESQLKWIAEAIPKLNINYRVARVLPDKLKPGQVA